MSQAMGMLDFFVLEAGEYLGRLDILAQAPAGTRLEAEEFLRIARAFRGSAVIASLPHLARAAQGLEAVGRAVRDGRLAWDERVRAATVRAGDDCRILLTRLRMPADDDTARAEAIGEALESLAGRPSATARPGGAGLDAGGRAFVARETAGIASALDRAARALAADPMGRDVLNAVTPAMAALRGVAVVNDLPPLADILVAVEGAIKEVHATSGTVGITVPLVFDAAAKALARAAREVVDLGRPAADSEDAARFASLLLSAFATRGHIVPIEGLFHDDTGPHVVRQGTAPPALTAVELTSQGDFLATAATELRRAASPVLRDLRLFGVAASLRPLAGAGGSAVSAALGRVADAGREAVDRGAAAAGLEAFAAIIADAADALRSAGAGADATVAARLDGVSARLQALPAPGAEAAPVRAPEIVAAAGAEPPSAPAAEIAPAAEPSGLALAFDTLDLIVAQRGLPPGSLDELVGVAAAAPDARPPLAAPASPAAPIEAAEEAGVVPVEALAPAAADDEAIVAIESLLYGPSAALRRALDLRGELEELAATGRADSARTAALLREVFDLVQLGLGAAR
jgi:hypothetical protein